MSDDWPKWKDMQWLRLNEGPGDGVILPVSPTMKNITYEGERYFRMPNTRARNDENGSHGGAYLWERYWDEVLKKEK